MFRNILLLLAMFSLPCYAAETDVFELRTNGSIPVWLVSGPFPNEGATKDHGANCSGYLVDYLVSAGGETNVLPAEGDEVQYETLQNNWIREISNNDGVLSFIQIFNLDQQTPGVAYAYSALISETAQNVILKIRSDDGVRVWLNSQLVHDHHVGRGLEDEEDSVPVRLKKGRNSLLVKVDQGDGGWGLHLRVCNDKDVAANGVRNQVDLLKQLTGTMELTTIKLNPVLVKSKDGFLNQLSFHFLSGGIQDLQMHIETGEQSQIQSFELGDFAIGKHHAEFEIPHILGETPVKIKAHWSQGEITFTVLLNEIKEWTVYLLPHSHVDIGYTHVQSYVEKYQWEHLENAIEYARRSADYPEGSRFKWNTEVLWAVESYLRQASTAKKEQFYEAVRKGWLGIDGLFANQLTGLCRPEELMRFMEVGQRIGQKTGIPVEAAMISDVPGYTWSMVPVMAQNGVKYFSIGPNPGHRIGGTLNEWGDKPFYWVSPSGEEKILCWVSSRGYASFHTGLNMTEKIRRISHSAIYNYLLELEENDFPYDMTYLRYNIGSDNGPPDAQLADFVKEWNEMYESPRLIIATTAELFKAFESKYEESIPSVSGDFTPYWEDGAASSALETSINRDNAERLVQAEKIWSMLEPGSFPYQKFEDAWRNVILYNEHTWGSWNSISEPNAEFTLQQWKVKQSFALDAEKRSKDLLKAALKPLSGSSKTVGAVQVVNTSSWRRNDLVILPEEWKLPGETVKNERGETVLSQRLSNGSLAFLAQNVPPMGSAKFTIHKGKAIKKGNARAIIGSLKNEFVAADIDAQSGTIRSLRTIDGNRMFELVDKEKGSGLNEYYYVAGRDPSDPLTAGNAKIRIKENGSLVASLLIESDAPGCNRLSREVRVVSGINRVDIINTVDKKNIFDQEGVHFAFPFHVPQGQMRVDIGWGHYRPEADQIPGSCKNYLTVQRWVDISNQDYGITWTTNDAPLIEIGEITSDPVSYGWIDHLKPSQKFYSYVMNNYWETNYKASQEGPVIFRYSIYPHRRFTAEQANRFGNESSQPLLAVPAEPQAEAVKSFLQVEPSTIVITSVRSAEKGRALLVRLFNAGARPETVQLNSTDSEMNAMYMSSPKGERGTPVNDHIEIPAFGIRTLRLEK